MRVLVVGLSRYSAPTGICRYADMLCRALSGIEGIQSTLVVGSWQEEYFREIFDSYSHSQLVSVDLRSDPFSRNIWYTTTLPAIARDLKADIVHFAYPVPFGRKFHCPTVVTVHDLYAYEVPRNFKFAAANRAFLKVSLRRCDAIICISRTTLQSLTRFLPDIAKNRILAQVYNPIYQPGTVTTQESVAELQPAKFLLSVGQHRPNKNLDLLQQAFAELRDNARIPSDWKLVIVGAVGAQTAELHGLARKLSLADHIVYLSSITDSQLAWLYRSCAVAAFPSSYEGLCMPVVEALWCGARVVCSDISTLREVGQNFCTYFALRPRPAESLANAISEAMFRPASVIQTLDLFNPSAAAEQIYRVYQSLVSAPLQGEPVTHKVYPAAHYTSNG
jgi:glycosyltransferase involved in cell wall biosynthesis